MRCDLCGKDAELYTTLIEGTELQVCINCSQFGKVLKRVAAPVAEIKTGRLVAEEGPEIIELVVAHYPSLVKQAREKAGLKQEELAQKLNEKESIIQKVETGHYQPSMKLARKLEKFLHITLVEETKIEKQKQSASSSAKGFTIGDLLKKRQ